VTMLVGWAFYNGLRLAVEQARVNGVWGYRIGFASAVIFCTICLAYLRWAAWHSLGRKTPPLWSEFFPPSRRGAGTGQVDSEEPPWDEGDH
jgi:hypothetical protein